MWKAGGECVGFLVKGADATTLSLSYNGNVSFYMQLHNTNGCAALAFDDDSGGGGDGSRGDKHIVLSVIHLTCTTRRMQNTFRGLCLPRITPVIRVFLLCKNYLLSSNESPLI